MTSTVIVVVACLVALSRLLRGSWIGTLNFIVLQWLGVRLAYGWSADHEETRAKGGGRWWSRHAPPRGVPLRWMLIGWVAPLTGWWSPFKMVFSGWRLRLWGNP